MGNATCLREGVAADDPATANQLVPLLYDDLRRLATCKLAREKPGQTLEATDLVHEAYLRLTGKGAEKFWDSRGHFFAAAAEAMRRILVENARRKRTPKYGGDRVRRPLDEADLPAPEPREDLLALDEALTQLADADPAAAELVQLRYFGGLAVPRAAESLGISPRTADRLWAYARAWLYQKIEGTGQGKKGTGRGYPTGPPPYRTSAEGHVRRGTMPAGRPHVKRK
jgi:RNA polymerase sigma factor (TIGR02999 family)